MTLCGFGRLTLCLGVVCRVSLSIYMCLVFALYVWCVSENVFVWWVWFGCLFCCVWVCVCAFYMYVFMSVSCVGVCVCSLCVVCFRVSA